MQIDEDILQEVVKMGFDSSQLIESLRNRVQNEVRIFETRLHYSPLLFSHFLEDLRQLLHTICYWITGSGSRVAILALSFRKLWYVLPLLIYFLSVSLLGAQKVSVVLATFCSKV